MSSARRVEWLCFDVPHDLNPALFSIGSNKLLLFDLQLFPPLVIHSITHSKLPWKEPASPSLPSLLPLLCRNRYYVAPCSHIPHCSFLHSFHSLSALPLCWFKGWVSGRCRPFDCKLPRIHRFCIIKMYLYAIQLNTSFLGQNLIKDKPSSSSSSVLGSIEKNIGKDVAKVANAVASDITKELNIRDFYSVHILDFCEVSSFRGTSRPHPAEKALLTQTLDLGLLHPNTSYKFHLQSQEEHNFLLQSDSTLSFRPYDCP